MGAKLVPKLVSTTPEGTMNSIVPPPFLVIPAGNDPSNWKPSRIVPPGGSGALGVMM